jgi:hypothetical protein
LNQKDNQAPQPTSSSRRRRAITPMETGEPYPVPNRKGAKKKLVFNEAAEKASPKQTNVLNLPYSDSESEPAIEEFPSDQTMEPDMEETPQIEVFTSFDEGEASTKKKISKSAKIQKMKEKIAEQEVLERVIKARYETLSKNAAKTREAFERLALIHVKEKKKRKKIMKDNHKLWKIVQIFEDQDQNDDNKVQALILVFRF